MTAVRLTERAAWSDLRDHHAAAELRLRELFVADAERGERLVALRAPGFPRVVKWAVPID